MRCALKPEPSRVSTMFPRRTAEVFTGATVTISPLAKLGCMLAPSARNRTGVPVRKKCSVNSPNRRESRRNCFSKIFTEQNLHCANVGHKRKFGTRNVSGDAAQEFQIERHRVRRVMRNKTPRVQFRGGGGARQRAQRIS